MALGSLEPLPFRHGYVATLSTHSGDSFGGVVSGLLLFIATPQLNLRLASSPHKWWRPLVRYKLLH